MNVIIVLGGIHLLSASLASIMNAATATAILGVTAGVMSWFSSTSGVVMPTLIPTVPHIIHQMSISVNPVEWVTAALAAYSSEAGAAAGEMDRLFVKMFGISAIGVVTLSTLAYFGFYRWLL